MDHVGLPCHPADLAIDHIQLAVSLSSLAGHVERGPDFWNTLLNERTITDAWSDAPLAGLRFPSN